MIAIADLVPLARGGTAELFVARAGAERVVVKCARDDRPGAIAALAAEAELLERLAPGLAPRLLGRTRVHGRDALVLEHLALPTLRVARPHATPAAIPTAAAICAMVARVHAAGIVHADLTPDNVLVYARGSQAVERGVVETSGVGVDEAGEPAVRLIDFGTAGSIGAVLAPLATVGYAAPERQLAGCVADPAVDVYALGVLCYELLTGVAPFAGTAGERRVAHAAHRVPRVAEQIAIAPALDALIARAMAKAPDQRPTAAALAELLAAAPSPTAAAPRSTVAAARGAQPAVLVGFRWTIGAALLRDRIAREGGTLAFSEADRHVAALWRGDAHAAATRLADSLRDAGAADVDVVEARVQIGATGVPRGAAIIALGRGRVEPAPAAPRALGTRPEPATPLIGRDDALATIASAAQVARDGSSALITVWGAPGLGKSRLATAAIAQLRGDGVAVIELRAPDVAQVLDALGEPARADDHGESARRADDDRAPRAFAHGDPARLAEDSVADPAAIDRAALAALAGRATIAGSAAEPLAAAPGALRQAAARALARRLVGSAARAILVDDAHAADPIVLDALELATLEPRGQLIVLALARPALAATRPRWSRRAARAEAITLAPLDRDAGRALIRALLPATAAVPSAALDRLVERCGGVPLYLTELVGALQRADRARGATTTATRGALATDLVELPAELGIVAWAVADELAGLSPGAVAAAEALAIGGDLARDDAGALFAALDAAGVGVELDPGVAIGDLCAAGVLLDHAGVLRFRHDLVREAIAARTAPARRAAIHHARLALARTPTDRARHAEGAGDRATAALAWQAAARDAQDRHDELAVETALTRALACLDAPPGELLRQRGGARARLGRHDAAAEDFAAARALAHAHGDRGAAIDVLLDEATALDWALHHTASAARVAEAAALAGDEPALRQARLAMATGRTAWRAGDAAGAIAPCRAAIALADPLGAAGYETAIACRLMLGFVLGVRGELADAAQILDEAERQAAARGDQLHVAAARCNRYPVHAARGDAAALRADLTGFAAAGRELGIAVTEYRGALYLALVALWCDDDAAALDHARAARRVEAADPALCPRPCAALILAELAARRADRADALAWCEVADRHTDATHPQPGAAIDRVMRAALATWARGALAIAEATALAHDAIALGEAEAAFQILELAARAAGDPAQAAAAHRAARTLPRGLPRFIPGLENALP